MMKELEKMFQEMIELLFEEFHLSAMGDDGEQHVQIWHTECGQHIWHSHEEVPLPTAINFCHNHKYNECKGRKS